MAIDFPNSPTTNQTYTVSGRTWKWTGSVWDLVNPEFTMTAGTSFPSSPATAQQFFRTDQKIAYIYTGSEWSELNNPKALNPFLMLGI
jgi:hypothetical protein